MESAMAATLQDSARSSSSRLQMDCVMKDVIPIPVVPFARSESLALKLTYLEYAKNFPYSCPNQRPIERNRKKEGMTFKASEIPRSIDEAELSLFRE